MLLASCVTYRCMQWRHGDESTATVGTGCPQRAHPPWSSCTLTSMCWSSSRKLHIASCATCAAKCSAVRPLPSRTAPMLVPS